MHQVDLNSYLRFFFVSCAKEQNLKNKEICKKNYFMNLLGQSLQKIDKNYVNMAHTNSNSFETHNYGAYFIIEIKIKKQTEK